MIKKVFSLIVALLVLNGCSNNSDDIMEEDTLESVQIEILFFEFIPDTGNNSQRLHYEINFINPNDKSIKGYHTITTNADGLVTSQISSNLSPCYEISPNSACTLSFDQEESYDTGLATVNSIELISVEYDIEK
ncbi:hypothetical protein [Maribacter sp. MAR_2009_72]|uniref:hypothetical protein n=1 Tax=Maribacter sp. MAR_2009_72 TaxID=1250050 RepID=UPI0011998C09|nr:hypothetical protein [Maribacter sp. MAR_2009_72]TVZ16292.1 hypothetical protein JM81_2551 [Maribacter sp. MAR_2009_72]